MRPIIDPDQQDRYERELRWLLALMVRRAGGRAYFKWSEIVEPPPRLQWRRDVDGTIHLETPMGDER